MATNYPITGTYVNNTQYFCKLFVSHINIRSILSVDDSGSRLDHLYNYMCKDNKIDIMFLSETKLDNTIKNEDIDIEGYQVYRKDRNRSGGGVAIYTRNEFQVEYLTDLNIDGIEMLWLKIMADKPFLVAVYYRPPNQSSDESKFFLDCMYATIDVISDKYKHLPIFIMGDFNDRCSSWLSSHKDSELGDELVYLLDSFNFIQLIDQPTRNQNLLDLFITSNPELVDNFGVLDPIHELDHCPIYARLSLKLKNIQNFKRTVRSYTTENLENLKFSLSKIQWENFQNNDQSIDDLVDFYTNTLNTEIKKAIPCKEVTIRPKDKPGMTLTVRKLFNKCHRLHRVAQKTGKPEDILKHKIARKNAKKSWKRAKSNYFEKLSRGGSKIKAHWKIIKCVTGRQNPRIPVIVDGDIFYSSDLEKCNIFNEYFAEQTRLDPEKSSDSSSLTDDCKNFNYSELIDDIVVIESLVKKILETLEIEKASGPDNIGNRILKSCSSSLAFPITVIVNKSLKDGKFPKQWKLSNVVPVYKKGDKQIKNNYRPISLLASTSKVLERIVYNNLYNHCLKHGLLSSKNSGFKRNDGTINQLLNLINKIYKGFDDEREIAVVFLDITKAFDRVWHLGLLHKLKKFGISGNLLNWFKSYLCDRMQRVVIGGKCSEILLLMAGVPQGSILGPLLFLVFINDLENSLESDINLYADDTILMKEYSSISAAETVLNGDLEKIEKWSIKWLVEFNPIKTYLINFSLKKFKSKLNIQFKGMNVTQVSEHKHLGLIFSEDMTWHKHVNHITAQASRQIGQMYRSSKYLPKPYIISLYLNTIRPILEYGSILFDNCTFQDSRKLENIQRRAALICTGGMRRTESSKMLQLLNWPSLEDRRKYQKLLMFFKLANNMAPSYLTQNLQRKLTGRNLRNNSDNMYFVPKTRLSCYKDSFFPSTTKKWNTLPDYIKNSSSLKQFKSKMNDYLNFKPANKKSYLFEFCQGFYGNMIMQMNFNVSKLNNHLYLYNITDNPFCPKCYDNVEDACHYLLKCSFYAGFRKKMLCSLEKCLSIVNIDLKVKTENDIIDIMLNGVEIDDFRTQCQLNNNIYKIMKEYVKDTCRFWK